MTRSFIVARRPNTRRQEPRGTRPRRHIGKGSNRSGASLRRTRLLGGPSASSVGQSSLAGRHQTPLDSPLDSRRVAADDDDVVLSLSLLRRRRVRSRHHSVRRLDISRKRSRRKFENGSRTAVGTFEAESRSGRASIDVRVSVRRFRSIVARRHRHGEGQRVRYSRRTIVGRGELVGRGDAVGLEVSEKENHGAEIAISRRGQR